MYYTIAADIELDYLKVSQDSLRNVMDIPLDLHIQGESPDNNDQPGFILRAKSNRCVMERYLGNPEGAPLPNQPDLPPFVDCKLESANAMFVTDVNVTCQNVLAAIKFGIGTPLVKELIGQSIKWFVHLPIEVSSVSSLDLSSSLTATFRTNTKT